MANDLSAYSDDELKKLYNNSNNSSVANMSDDELKKAYFDNDKNEAAANFSQPELGTVHKLLNGIGSAARSFGQGALEQFEGLTQAGAEGLSKLPISSSSALSKLGVTQKDVQNIAENYTKSVERQQARAHASDSGAVDSIASFAGGIAPWLLAPELRFLKAGEGAGLVTKGLMNLLRGGTEGAAIGGAQFVPEGGSRVENMESGGAVGGLLGGGLPVAAKAIGSPAGWLGKKIFGDRAAEAGKKLFSGVSESPGLVDEVKERVAQAKELDPDLKLRPSQATLSPALSKIEGQYGKTPEEAYTLDRFNREQNEANDRIIGNILNDIHPEKGTPSGLRAAALDANKQIQDAASQAYSNIFERVKNTPASQEALQQVSKSPLLSSEAAKLFKMPESQEYLQQNGINKGTLGGLDYLKRHLNDLEDTAKAGGANTYSTIIKKANNSLKDILNREHPEYAEMARNYEEATRPLRKGPSIESFTHQDVNRLANMTPNQLKRVGQDLFSPNQDLDVLSHARDEIVKKNPQAWNGMVRAEIERRLDKAQDPNALVSNLYKNVLASNKNFDMFKTATSHIPGMGKKLDLMRNVYATLSKPDVLPSIEKEVEHEIPHSLSHAVGMGINKALSFVHGTNDKAVVNLITSGKWDKYFEQAAKIKNPTKRAAKVISLVNRASEFTASNQKNWSDAANRSLERQS